MIKSLHNLLILTSIIKYFYFTVRDEDRTVDIINKQDENIQLVGEIEDLCIKFMLI